MREVSGSFLINIGDILYDTGTTNLASSAATSKDAWMNGLPTTKDSYSSDGLGRNRDEPVIPLY